VVADTREEYSQLFDVYVPVALAVFVIVLLALVFVVLRFRSRANDFPGGKRSDSRLEGAYLVLVALIVAGLLGLTYSTMSDQSAAERDANGPVVEVTAGKWRWRFDYPGYRISQQAPAGAIATLVVPVDTDIRFRLTSVDVIHAFWIPERRFKRDAFPDRTTTFTLRFPTVGFVRQAGECAQFCGLDHASMDFNVNVLGRAQFRRWVANKLAEIKA
jgi:cytochrome c oxidase subunit 2